MKGGSRLVSLPKAVSRARRRVANLLSVARTWPVVGSEDPADLPLSVPVLARGRDTPTTSPGSERGWSWPLTGITNLTASASSVGAPGSVDEPVDEPPPDPVPYGLQGICGDLTHQPLAHCGLQNEQEREDILHRKSCELFSIKYNQISASLFTDKIEFTAAY